MPGVTQHADLLWPSNKMSKLNFSSYFGSERNEETQKDKDQDLRVEEAEGDGNTNPKVRKTSNESSNFQAKWNKRTHVVEIRKSSYSMFSHFRSFVKK